jgi:putative ABC transport system ATP-binding protein
VARLEIRDLVVEYTTGGYSVRAIDGLELDAQPGSLIILLGPSGCGKTTLLSCLGGILSPTSGTIRFGDIDVTALRGNALTEYRRSTVGIVFQAFNLVASMTARENVMVPMRAAGMKSSAARAKADALLSRVGLEDRAHHRPGDMSGGQQQRVAVARAIALDPQLVVADEPTAHLDFIQVEAIVRLLRELATGDRMVVVSTHDERLIPIADHVVEMVPKFRLDDHEPERVLLSPGDVLFRQGDYGELVYVVDVGRVEVVRELADGGEEVLASLGAGEYFGEMAPLLGLPRSGTARAVEDTALTSYTVRRFREQVGGDGLRRQAAQESMEV